MFDDAPKWTPQEIEAMNPGPRVTYRPKEKICLFCGKPSAGYRRIVAQADTPDSGPEYFDVPLCPDHAQVPAEDVLEAVRASMALQEASYIQDQAQELTKRPCIACDRPAHGVKMLTLNADQARLMGEEVGSFLLVPLCKDCGDAKPELWIDAVIYQQEVQRHGTLAT